MASVTQLARAVNLVIFDVDGVLTDGRLFFDHEGREYKSFHARDGHGLKLLQASGVETAIISGRSSAIVAARMQQLGIRHVYQGQENKLAALNDLSEKLAISSECIAHVGDDLLDLPIMCRVGMAIAVADAHPAVCEYAHWQTSLPGGFGAVREVCDLIMQAQGNYDSVVAEYLQK